MNHRQGTCRTGNSGYPGTKEPTLQIVLSLHDCMTAACSLHSADLTAAVSGVAAPGALLRSRWWRSGARCAGSGAQLEWRRACGGRQLTVRGAGETTPAQQQQSPTPERSYCYTAVLLWFLVSSGDHRDIIGIRMTWIPSHNLKLIIWRRAVQSIKQRDTKKDNL